MADFCKQCSLEVFGKDFRDLAGLTSEEDWAVGKAVYALCEGCGGMVQVDPEGRSIEDLEKERNCKNCGAPS